MENLYKKEKMKRILTLGTVVVIVGVLFFTLFGGGKTEEKKVEGEIRLVDEKQTLEEGMRARYASEISGLHDKDEEIAKSLSDIANKLNEIQQGTQKQGEDLKNDFNRKLDQERQAREKATLEERQARERANAAERERVTQELAKAIEKQDNSSVKKALEDLKKLQLEEKENKKELQEEAKMIPPPPGLEGLVKAIPAAPSENNNQAANNNTNNSPNGINTAGYNNEAPIAPPTFQVMTGLIAGADLSSNVNKLETGKKTKKKKKEKKFIIPTGSFVKAKLLSGVIAPTAGKGASDPVPALIRVTGITQLPNFHNADFRNCFLLAETKGDLATEKVSFRINKISCVDRKGNVLEKGVSAYVTGENGIEGLQGRVVSKQGQVLARAFISDFLGGIGSAFKQAGQLQTVTGAGIVTMQDANQVWQSGLANGFSESMTRLSDFYMDLADQMVPVIEINAGRDMDVVFTNQVDLSPDSKNTDSEDEDVEESNDKGQVISRKTKAK